MEKESSYNKDLVKTLSEKYGEGNFDPKTGSFIPVEKK